MLRATSIFLISFLVACSNQATYNSIKHNQCLEKTGQIYCDDIEEYEEYERKRKELLEDKS